MNIPFLRKRAELLESLRNFFRQRGFLEVETPLLDPEVIPERHIELHAIREAKLFLQASPEMHMKRLLCEGSGPIFQITRSFRSGEYGPLHRPEFTLTEWYRPDDDMQQGMKLLEELLQETVGVPTCQRTSYRDAFLQTLAIDPHEASIDQLRKIAATKANKSFDKETNRDELLNVLLAIAVEPTLGAKAPEVLFHYPASQASLASLTSDPRGVEVAERFELYWRGVELANGYHELLDASELRFRLEQENRARGAGGLPPLPLPEGLIAAMESPGLPPCAGVALGFDRLTMLALCANSIGDVMACSESPD